MLSHTCPGTQVLAVLVVRRRISCAPASTLATMQTSRWPCALRACMCSTGYGWCQQGLPAAAVIQEPTLLTKQRPGVHMGAGDSTHTRCADTAGGTAGAQGSSPGSQHVTRVCARVVRACAGWGVCVCCRRICVWAWCCTRLAMRVALQELGGEESGRVGHPSVLLPMPWRPAGQYQCGAPTCSVTVTVFKDCPAGKPCRRCARTRWCAHLCFSFRQLVAAPCSRKMRAGFHPEKCVAAWQSRRLHP
jgi:hypothetical protein